MISFRYKDIYSKIKSLLYKMSIEGTSCILGNLALNHKWRSDSNMHISMVGKFLIGLGGIEEVIFSISYKMRVGRWCSERKI